MSSSKTIDREAPVQGAIVIHPDREGRSSSRQAAARLEEAVGLAQALDLEVRETLIANLRQLTPATLFGTPEGAEVVFDTPERAVAPGQACVFYDGTRVLGGGFILRDA